MGRLAVSTTSEPISFAKTGFPNKEVIVTGTLSGWFIGNIVFGGLIGMLAVDPVTGAMYVFPDTISGNLAPEPAKRSGAGAGIGTLTVVSTAALSAEQMAGARLLGAAP